MGFDLRSIVKKWLIFIFALFVLVFAIVTPLFTLLSVSVKVNGVTVSSVANGYQLLVGVASEDAADYLGGIYPIITQAIVALIVFAVIYSFKGMLDNENKKAVKSMDIAVICFFMASLFYFVVGINVVNCLLSLNLGSEFSVKTVSYFPFVIAIVFLVLWVVLRKTLYRDTERKDEINCVETEDLPKKANKNSSDNAENLSLLIKYKELLDAGVLSPEEYYKAKSNLLD